MERPPIYFDIPLLRPGTIGAYTFAFLCAGVATALRLALDPYLKGAEYVVFFPAVIVTGLFCLALSVGAVVFFLLPPRFSFYIEETSDALTTLLFVLLTFTNVIVIAGMRFTMERCQELSRRLERHEVALREREVERQAERLVEATGGSLQQAQSNDAEAAGRSP
jgi:K+-sensing histidine kinase KdpD